MSSLHPPIGFKCSNSQVATLLKMKDHNLFSIQREETPPQMGLEQLVSQQIPQPAPLLKELS